jgi:hypothetical protein
MMNLRELITTIGEASINAVERLHSVDFVLGLRNHAGFLGTVALFLGTRPYIALILFVIAYCIVALMRRWRRTEPPVSPTPPDRSSQKPQKRPSALKVRIRFSWPPEPPRTRKPRTENNASTKRGGKARHDSDRTSDSSQS